jgi:hypothetical protein
MSSRNVAVLLALPAQHRHLHAREVEARRARDQLHVSTHTARALSQGFVEHGGEMHAHFASLQGSPIGLRKRSSHAFAGSAPGLGRASHQREQSA